MTQPATVELGARTPARQRGSAWPAGLACIALWGVTVLSFRAYSLLHWRIIHSLYGSLSESQKTDIFHLLGSIGQIYHLSALLSVIFGIWTFWSRPRWIRWVCSPLIVLSIIVFTIVM